MLPFTAMVKSESREPRADGRRVESSKSALGSKSACRDADFRREESPTRLPIIGDFVGHAELPI